MIKSMTGYAKAEALIGERKYSIEIKSLNHRYLDLSVRLPYQLNPLEPEIRKKMAAVISRGKIDLVVRIEGESVSQGDRRLGLNLPLLMNYCELFGQIKAELGLKEEISLSLLAGIRDLFVPVGDTGDQEMVRAEFYALLDEATRALGRMKEEEGAALGRTMIESADLFRDCLDKIADRGPQILLEYKRRLAERVKVLNDGVAVDEMRLAQEVAFMAEKSDITEEIKRIESHLCQFFALIQGDQAEGKKLDFLFQELGREVNTISSKSSDVPIANLVITMKMELAKLREQVQNIE